MAPPGIRAAPSGVLEAASLIRDFNVYAYRQAFASSQYGPGAAIGVVALLVLPAVTLVCLRLLRRQGEEL
ncbi:hypothetical protein [Streptomyces sp. NPDC086777]|uniref:hypothetical protein n=1 Tax=Streptomyces sp. NPDC086777 TaxID=3154866 RepID=UPI00344D508F